MKKKTEEFLQKFGEKTLKYLENLENFTKKEAPEYVTELLKFSFFESLMSLCFIIPLMGASIFGLSNIDDVYNYISDSSDKLFLSVLLGLGSSLTLVTTFVGLNNTITTLYKIHAAPRVFLVEYFTNLVKKGDSDES